MLRRVVLTSALAGGVALGLGVAIGAWARASAPDAVVSVPLPYAGFPGGGWSGVDVSPDGARFWAITDAGARTEGAILRDGTGRITGIDAPPPYWIGGMGENRYMQEPHDSEGIDADPETGETLVAFEGWSRLRRYAEPDGHAAWVPDLPAEAAFPRNAGLEAVALDAAGRPVTLPEVPVDGAFPVYRLTEQQDGAPGGWEILARLSHDPMWRAVGADFGPDGGFYLLERFFAVAGFASRVRRFDLPETAEAGAAVLEGEILYRAPVGRHGNLEGIGIWRDADGALRAVMVSDDNHRFFQRSELVEVILPLAPGAPGG